MKMTFSVFASTRAENRARVKARKISWRMVLGGGGLVGHGEEFSGTLF
jgi:hypothetical protein